MASLSCSGGSFRNVSVIFAVLGLTLCSASLRGRNREHSDQMVGTRDIESTLRASLDAVIGGGDSIMTQRLARIEEGVWQTFQALPKNAAGRLAPRSVRYIIHSYFAKEHGWLINGMEPDMMHSNMSELHDVDILQDKAPAFVESLLEARQGDRGLSLSDVVAMAAALERLVVDESIALLGSSYTLNGHDTKDMIDEATLHEVLTSYLLVFELGSNLNLTDARKHQLIKEKKAASSAWASLMQYEGDAVRNFGERNNLGFSPKSGRQYSFQEASQIVEDLAQGYGKWQNAECHQMKHHLMDLVEDGSGRVSLKSFYSQRENPDYHFTESVDYLRKIGALDESSISNPKVRLTNYLAGPSNCIASSAYYSVCCISECEGLRNALESKIQAPVASAQHLLDVVGNLSSSTMSAPRKLPKDLTAKLHSIADRHSDEVPLHGRLFTQWLHYAFPNECPYPHIAESKAALSAVHWRENGVTATVDERQLHIDSAKEADAEESTHCMSQWTDDEILPFHLPDSLAQSRERSWSAGAMRTTVQLAMLFVVCRIAFSTWRQAMPGGKVGKQSGGFLLPLREKCA